MQYIYNFTLELYLLHLIAWKVNVIKHAKPPGLNPQITSIYFLKYIYIYKS